MKTITFMTKQQICVRYDKGNNSDCQSNQENELCDLYTQVTQYCQGSEN